MQSLDQFILFITEFSSAHPFVVFLLSMCSLQLIEISPIKIAPFTWLQNKFVKLFKKIMSDANKEYNDKICEDINMLRTEVGDLKSEVSTLLSERDKEKALDMRREILNFSDDLVSKDRPKSKKNYERILFSVYPRYEEMIKKTGLTNGQVDEAYKYALRKYFENLENGSFKKFYGEDYETDEHEDIESLLISLQNTENNND